MLLMGKTNALVLSGLNETGVSIVVTSHELLEKMRDRFGEISTLKYVIHMDRADKPVPRSILGKTWQTKTILIP